MKPGDLWLWPVGLIALVVISTWAARTLAIAAPALVGLAVAVCVVRAVWFLTRD